MEARALEVGVRAHEALRVAASGAVLFGFTHGFVLRTNASAIVWCDVRDDAFGTSGVRLDAVDPTLARDVTFTFDADTIHFANGATLQLPATPTADAPAIHARCALANERAEHLLARLAQPPDPLAAYARAQCIAAASRFTDGAPFESIASDIVGLGPGLTPSGDDFLGGFALGLRARDAFAGLDAKARATLFAATHAVSATRLACHIDGLALRAERALLARLTEDRSDLARDAIDHALARVCALGHHSGGDFACGLAHAFTVDRTRVEKSSRGI